MKSWFLSIAINMVAILAVSALFEGIVVAGFGGALLAALILSILNTIVKPVLIILTLPITVISLGLFLLVINATTLWLTDLILGETFEIASFGIAVVAAVLVSIINLIMHQLMK